MKRMPDYTVGRMHFDDLPFEIRSNGTRVARAQTENMALHIARGLELEWAERKIRHDRNKLENK